MMLEKSGHFMPISSQQVKPITLQHLDKTGSRVLPCWLVGNLIAMGTNAYIEP